MEADLLGEEYRSEREALCLFCVCAGSGGGDTQRKCQVTNSPLTTIWLAGVPKAKQVHFMSQ